VQQSSDKDP